MTNRNNRILSTKVGKVSFKGKKIEDKIYISEEEYKNLRVQLYTGLQIAALFTAVTAVVTATVYAVYTVGPSIHNSLINLLFRLYVLSGSIAGIGAIYTVYKYVVWKLFDKGKVSFYRKKKPTYCINVERKDLKNKNYVICKVLFTKIAFRLKEK